MYFFSHDKRNRCDRGYRWEVVLVLAESPGGFTWEVVLVLPEPPGGFTWEVVLVLPEPPVAAWCGPWSAPQGHSGPCDFSPGESQ